MKIFNDGKWITDAHDREFEESIQKADLETARDAARAYRKRIKLLELLVLWAFIIGFAFAVWTDGKYYNPKLDAKTATINLLANELCEYRNDSGVQAYPSTSGRTIEIVCENTTFGVK